MTVLGLAIFAASQLQCFSAEVCDCPLNDICHGIEEVEHLVSFPIIIGYYGYPKEIVIYGASDLSRIEMTVPAPNEYYTIEPYPGADYVFEATREAGLIHCHVQSNEQVFGKKEVLIYSRFYPPVLKYETGSANSGDPADCGNYAFVAIAPSTLKAFDGNGDEVVIEARSGSLFYLSAGDLAEEFLFGRVLYRDGITPCARAVIYVCAINGARYDTNSGSSQDGCYSIYRGVGGRLEWPRSEGIEAATGCYRLTVRVCLSQCSDCFEPEEIVLNRKEGGGIELGYHDFILPIDPPSPTPTPTATETPSPTPSATPNPADINRDGKVDHEDVYLLKQHWLEGTE